MATRFWFLLVPVLFAVSAVAQIPISVGQTVNGNLSTSSGRANACDNSPGAFADIYQFSITTSQILEVAMTSTAFDTCVRVKDTADTTLIENDDIDWTASNTNSRVARSFTAGTYRIEATGYSLGQSGPYTLTLRALNAAAISVGQTLSGRLTPASLRSVGCGFCYADIYQFTIAATQTLAIRMSSTELDSFLRVLDSNGVTIIEDDESGGNQNALIQRSFTPGTYRIEAAAYSSDQGGAYTVSLQQALSGGTTMTIPGTVNGTLNAADGRSAGCGGCYADLYRFTLNSQQTLVITLESALPADSGGFDTFINVLDAAGTIIAFDDDSLGNYNSSVAFTFSPGTYTIEATSYNSEQSGAYVLKVEAPPARPTIVPIAAGGRATGILNSASSRSGACTNCYADLFRFTVTGSPATLAIEMTSQAFDAYLRVLTSAGSVVATDDDSAGGLNALITHTFPPGEYTIEATTINGGTPGAYSLAVRVAPALVVRPLTIPQTVNSNLSSGRSVGCSSCFAELYQFTAPSTQFLTISVTATGERPFDTFLRVLNNEGVTLASDDDSGGGANSRLARNVAAGTYRLEVSSYSAGETGPYELTIVAGTLPRTPAIASLSPPSTAAGGPAFTLVVNGNGFTSASVVRWNGSNRPTRLVGTELRADISAADIAVATAPDRPVSVTVFTPPPGGGTSAAISFRITASAALLEVTPFLSFTTVEGANPAPRQINIDNLGGAPLAWTAALTVNAGNWLSLSSLSGTTPSTPTASVNVAGLAAGAYSGTIRVLDASGVEKTVPITLVVNRAIPVIAPTRSSFVIYGVEGAPSVPTQTFQILNTGQGTLNWNVLTRTSDGRSWLRVSPQQGASQGGAATGTPITVQVIPSGLREGTYTALLTIEAAGAANTPVTAIVLLHMRAAGADPIGSVQPAGLTFVGSVGAAAPAAQQLQLSTTGGKQIEYTVSTATETGGNWLSVGGPSGTLPASGAPVNVSVQPVLSGLSTGVYRGSVTVSLSSGVNHVVGIALAVAPAPAAFAVNSDGEWTRTGAESACIPTRMTMIETTLSSNFTMAVNWLIPLLAQVVNDCGEPVVRADVSASFSSGDSPFRFRELGGGRYSAAWSPGRAAQSVVMTMRALAQGLPPAELRLEGKVNPAGGLRPLVPPNAAVNGASFAAARPLAPGTIFSLFGQNLASGIATATTTPLPSRLGDVEVTISGRPAPLFFASQGQVNAQVPFDVPAGSTASLVVMVNRAPASPSEITIANVTPGIFTMNAEGQGAITHANSRDLVDASRPAAAGDVITIYTTGLGATSPAVATGVATPTDRLYPVRVQPTVTIDGRNAEVLFAGLAPTFVGLYQLNVRVPQGVTAGSSVPVIITQEGVASNTARIAVR